ncbi:MAG TPA: hypothetical protein VLM76_11865, partial [Patescibacteria group bacterium]|nr:hypothetical protein [Patescibacteria group bacterium]
MTRRICSECFRPMVAGLRRMTCSPDCERRLLLRRHAAFAAGHDEDAVPAAAGTTVPALVEWAGIEDEANPCYYCGLAADSVDHVVPRSILDALVDSGLDGVTAAIIRRSRQMVVPCCRECNNLAGAKYHETLAERAAFVRERLAHRHRKALAMPDWSATELAELSPGLRGLVIAGLFDRDLLRRRLRFRA